MAFLMIILFAFYPLIYKLLSEHWEREKQKKKGEKYATKHWF